MHLYERPARQREAEPLLGEAYARHLPADRQLQEWRVRVREIVLEQQTALVLQTALARQTVPQREIEPLLGKA